MWLEHDHLKDFLNQQWALIDGSVLDKTCALVKPLLLWNSTVFGHLRQRKARLLVRSAGIHKAICQGKALFWQQKSRVKWLQEGDQNTKFFHLATLIRRIRNKIERLKGDNGEWIEGVVGLKELAAIDLANLVRSIDFLEVKESLFHIDGLKAHEVDGFPACFFQNQSSFCFLQDSRSPNQVSFVPGSHITDNDRTRPIFPPLESVTNSVSVRHLPNARPTY
ncbi:unnamed protein product [Prunus armeniaca]